MVRSGRNTLEDIVDGACNRMESIINNWSKVKSADVIKPALEKEKQKLLTREFKRAVEELGQSAERMTKNSVKDFMTEAEEVLMKFLPDIDSDEVVKKISSKVDIEIENAELFSYRSQEEGKKNPIFSVLENGLTMVAGGAIGVGLKEGLKAGYHAITHEKKKEEMLNALMDIRNMDMSPYLDTIFSKKEQLIAVIKTAFITDLIEPIQSQVEDVLSNTHQREQEKADAELKVAQLKEDLSIIKTQLAAI